VALEARILRQSALRREMGRYKALFEEGLIASEVYRDLTSRLEDAQGAEAPPRFDIGLDTERLIARLDLFATLDRRHLAGVQKLLRPRFTFPNELIVRKGERGDAVFFIASGAAEVILPDRRISLGSGDFFGEMSLITGEPRQADVRSQTYCRLLVLRKADFDRFMSGIHSRWIVSCGGEVVCAFAWREGRQQLGDFSPESFDGALCGFSQERLELGESVLDRFVMMTL
jgi:monovalent cation:H+ antiporter, CPA1 family